VQTNPIHKLLKFGFTLSILLSCSLPAFSWVKLASIFSEGMVLQRDKPIKIWGKASKDEVVNIEIKGNYGTGKPDKNGYWEAVLPAMPAGGPYEIAVLAAERQYIADVLIGEVFLVSGGSNMEMSMGACSPIYQDTIATSKDRLLRICQIAHTQAGVDQYDCKLSNWFSASPKSVTNFSAIGYLYARQFRQKYKVPVGIIQATWEETTIEQWLPHKEAATFPELAYEVSLMKGSAAGTQDFMNGEFTRLYLYMNLFLNSRDKSPETPAFTKKKWLKDISTTFDWPSVYEPGKLREEYKDKTGIYFLTKKFKLPNKMRAADQYSITLGDSDSEDSIYINGKYVGSSKDNSKERKYVFYLSPVVDSLSILVRLVHYKGKAGYEPNSAFRIACAADTINIKGGWHTLLGLDFVKEQAPNAVGTPEKPTALFNAMVAPILRYSMRSVLLFHGENNTLAAIEFKAKLAALITGYRRTSEDLERTFQIIQLHNYQLIKSGSEESNLAILRDAELNIAREMNRVGIVNTIDLGGEKLLSPMSRYVVATRLLQNYEQKADLAGKLPIQGCVLEEAKIHSGEIRLSFGENLPKGNPENAFFAIADENGKWKWAKATVKRNKIILTHPEIANPKYVRYAWADNPNLPLLYDKNNYPAFAFRTDVFSFTSKTVKYK